MTVKIENGKITIVLDIKEKISASGKSLIIATTGGSKNTEAEYNGEKVIVGVNAYIPINK